MKSCRLSEDADAVDYLVMLISANSIPSNPGVAKDYSQQPTSGLMPEYLNNTLANPPVVLIALDKHGYARFSNEMAVCLFGFPLIN